MCATQACAGLDHEARADCGARGLVLERTGQAGCALFAANWARRRIGAGAELRDVGPRAGLEALAGLLVPNFFIGQAASFCCRSCVF
ncbi:hypothetical protein Pyn_22923 [Prunus yedoensis var. nudiflora]|uniref:Uncharacterized protein n=1 Tax=Prunus yedoensis var. nudiflora TaxID=2094558 RepID=A0A314US57_PRUYE|nr:hypothetical protein Pyn_22923 [Prunus yedoensis var. nudiflora]